MLGDLFRVKLDKANDKADIEIRDGAVADTMKFGPGGEKGHATINVDAEGYVLSVSVGPLSEFLKLLAAD